MSKSIISNEKRCYFTGRTTGIDRHHLLHGNGVKQLAEQDGLWIWIDHQLHMLIHDKGYFVLSYEFSISITDKELQAFAQRVFIKNKVQQGYTEGQARGIFFNRYGRFYD